MSSLYLGVVINSNDFYNFEPKYSIEYGSLTSLKGTELDLLLEDSQKKNVNFAYRTNEKEIVDEEFFDTCLKIFEYDENDVEDNFDRYGEYNKTRYKFNAINLLDAKKIRPIEDEGFYYVIPFESREKTRLEGDRIELDSPLAVEGRVAFVELEQYGIYAGPYVVEIRDIDNQAYVMTKARDNKYTISGYSTDELQITTISGIKSYYEDEDYKFYITEVFENNERITIDVIDDEHLLEIFKNEIVNRESVDSTIKLDEVKRIVDEYNDSIFSGESVTEEIRKQRLNKIIDLLDAKDDIEDNFELIISNWGYTLYDLLCEHKNSEGVQQFINELLNQRKDIFDDLSNVKPIQERIERLYKEESELREDKEKLLEEIERLKENKEDSETIIERTVTGVNEEIRIFEEKKGNLKKEIEELEGKVGLYKEYEELKFENDYLKKDNEKEMKRAREIQEGTDQLELGFKKRLKDYNEQMFDIAFDGFMSNKMLEASTKWEEDNREKELKELYKIVESMPVVNKAPNELIDYLYSCITTVRPGYTRNDIINIAICFTQGFLTVFSGKPGSGKTSICNIFAEVLGLNKANDYVMNYAGQNGTRFIPVSVERGWTSKRDFIGYYNPLTKSFDKNNRQIFEALRILSLEKKNSSYKLPCMILLDEANLSPMEYYWADFMNICDNNSGVVNLGGDMVFNIPETLHFMATINNDHTTEVLSPRLIDRAWIITLPKSHMQNAFNDYIEDEKIEIISWDSIKSTFGADERKTKEVSSAIKPLFDRFVQHFEKRYIDISPRIEIAVKNYCGTAAYLFEDKTAGVESLRIAFDFAVAQKLLPKIRGGGEDYKQWLEELRQLCSANSLYRSADLVQGILKRGEDELNYYEFFN